MKEFIEEYLKRDYVDTNRVYVTGYSMGGDLTLRLGMCCPEIMTTIMPVCGGL